jgi:CBS domain-containing protein
VAVVSPLGSLARRLNFPSADIMETNIASIDVVADNIADLPESSPTSERVAARAGVAIKVPSWFTSGAALRVAQLKGVEHLLVLDRGVVVGTVTRRALGAAPAHEPLARTMVPSTATVSAEASLREARALMDARDLACLPVTSGPLLVGVIAREDLVEEHQRAAG